MYRLGQGTEKQEKKIIKFGAIARLLPANIYFVIKRSKINMFTRQRF
jgi:hypothetical protein